MHRGVVAASLIAVLCLQLRAARADEPPPPPPAEPVASPDAAPPAAPVQPAEPAPSGAPAEPAVPRAMEPTPLVETNKRIEITYRWKRWIPWAVLGGGAGVIGIGSLLQWSATSLTNEYDQAVASMCAVNGCNLTDPQTPDEQRVADYLNDMRERAERRNKIALVTVAVGAGVVITGIVMVLMNRPVSRTMKSDLVPVQGGAAATLTWQF
jgi:hypothetical protein